MFSIINKIKKRDSIHGFTVIEMIVSLSLFIVVSLIGVGSLLTIIEANRRAQSLKSVVNNLSFGLESLSKTMRVGSTYHCNTGPSVPAGFDSARNCSSAPGGDLIAFEASAGNPSSSADQIIYRLNGTKIERSINGGTSFFPVTSSEVNVTSLNFYVFGANSGDGLHPRVIIIMRGNVDLGKNARTDFNIQTSVSQRGLDT